MKKLPTWSLTVAVLLLGAWGANELAFGHASLVTAESNVQPGAVLAPDEVPARIVLTFDEELEPTRSAIWVLNLTDAEDVIVDTGVAGVDLEEPDRNTLTAELPAEGLEPGLYRVKWVAITPDDAGFREGELLFVVQAP